MSLFDLIPWSRERGLTQHRPEGDPFWALHRELNRVFEDFARGFDIAPWSSGSPGAWPFHPPIDIRETDEEIQVTADLPGMEQKDIEITLTERMLTLRGEKRREHEERQGESAHRLERSYGAFQRSIPLACEVEADKVAATFKHGVLNVTLPKAASARREVRRIEVQGS